MYFPWYSPALILALLNDVISTAEVTESHYFRETWIGEIAD